MTSEKPNDLGFDTRSIHTGRDPDCSSMPIYMASTGKYHYTRGGNPTNDAFEASVASLEGGAGAVVSACGMSAVTQTLLTLLKNGDRIVCHRSVYDWTDMFLREDAPKFGIETVQLDLRDLAALRRALEKPTKIVYFEPLSNPGLDMIDAKKVTEIAHEAGAMVVVDNTFLSPALLRPLELGADVVLHSATKFLCGHGDSMGGIAVANDKDLLDKLHRGRCIYGGVISPFNSFLILRGISTLTIRVKQHCANAQKVAEFLATHPAVAETRYPGLPGDPGHKTACALLDGFGGMVGITLKGGQAAKEAFGAALELCKRWVSLGDTSTLVFVRPPEARKGIPEGYVRISVGLENVEDIIADLDQALGQARSAESR